MLRWFPKLEDKTNGYTPYSVLSDKIEKEYNEANVKPDYIIRKLNINRTNII